MDRIKKNFGFGCMRLPLIEGKVDIKQTKKMVDIFLENGFNYFDTAHGYLEGQSETALRECLTSRYDRDQYVLTNKLSSPYFHKESDIRPFFEMQLKECGVSYFDFYLMHAQGSVNYEQYQNCRAYETAFALKKEGKIRHLGISFHDTPEFLEKILTDHPEVEVVQIQFNYADYNSPAVQSKKVYEVCRKFNKPIIVMEPLKGGNLVKLPPEARKVLDNLHGGSPASFALRFAAGFPGIMMVLSGMSSLEQMNDNISFMKDFKKLDKAEEKGIGEVCALLQGKHLIPCTACRYCVEGCPKKILIPDLFASLNTKRMYNDWNADYYYHNVCTLKNGKASDCLKCGKCEQICPQHLKIRSLLEEVAKEFDTNR